MTLTERISALASDGDLDIEDIETAAGALFSGGLDSAEADALRSALRGLSDRLEPGARQYLEDRLAGRPAALVPRLLLAPPPRGGPADLYHPRSDVIALQEALRGLGATLTVDGDYGGQTMTAVGAVQAEAGLPGTGLVDSRTLLRLNGRLEAAGLPLLDTRPRARIRPDQVVAMRGAGDAAVISALQRALCGLSAHFAEPALAVTHTRAFDPATEGALRAFQRRVYLPDTGLLDRSTLGAVNAALAVAGLPGVEAGAPVTFRGKVELHFFPGPAEHKVYVLEGGEVRARYGMVGGGAESKDDPNNPTVNYSPSPAGRFEVMELSPHASGAWSWSYVPYGARLREREGEVEFEDQGGVWRRATGPSSVFLRRDPPPLTRSSYLDAAGELLPIWTKNDFGHLRGRLRDSRGGQLQAHMIHSSPFNQDTPAYFADTARLLEPEAALEGLRHSHGCEHIHPRDLDDMVARGFLAPGTRFVIHGYDEVFSPPGGVV